MSTEFDPYHRWLGIPPKHQPADHYRLLAIERFEADPEVIADAAERQIAHVRRYALGPHQDISQRILNELAAGGGILLGLLAVVLWSWFSGRGVGDMAEAGRLRTSGGQSSATRPTPEAKPDAEPAKPEQAKKEPEKTEPAAEQISEKSPPSLSGVRPMDTAEMARRREAIDSFAKMGRAEESRLQKSAAGLPQEIENSIGMRFKLIPAGEFLMGSPDGDSDAESDEKSQHLVRITKPIYLGVTEVTQEQYERVMGQNPSKFKGDPQRPVEMVSWEDAVAFCRKLSEQEGQTYRLPTEAEWEYACRAGSQTKWSFGDDEAGLKEHAWFRENLDETAHPVAQKKPNAFGLCDMHGNVWEWCHDWYAGDYYAASPTDDPLGPESGSYRVYRGGCWCNDASYCRSACRDWYDPGYRCDYLGFRLARAVSLASPAR